jgi:hypothetical protein
MFTYWKINAAYIYDVRACGIRRQSCAIGKFLAQVPRHRGTAG